MQGREDKPDDLTQATLRGAGIIVADDDEVLSQMMATFLAQNGFETYQASDRTELRYLLGSKLIDVVLTNLCFSRRDGLQLVREAICRRRPAVIIADTVLDQAQRVVALERGADDFVSKPYSPWEVLARIHAIIRCRRVVPSRPRSERYLFSGMIFDVAAGEISEPAGASEKLTHGEVLLLRTLVSNPQRAMSRAQLVNAGSEHFSQPVRSVDVQIGRLRRKLRRVARRHLIRTDRGRGYALDADVQSL